MKFKKVLLSRSPFEKMYAIVPPYEAAVLKSVHSEDGCHEVEDVEVPFRPMDAEDEIQRLKLIYGKDAETKVSHVERALGFNAKRDIAEWIAAETPKQKKAA